MQDSAQDLPVAPVARVEPHAMTLFDDTRVDNYFWLRDRNNPHTIAYLEAENTYTHAVLKHTEPLQAQLYQEMLARIQQTDQSVPVQRGEYFYYTRTVEGLQYNIYCRKHQSLDAPEEIILDCNVLAAGQKYFRIGNFAPSPNHRLLAYSVDLDGDETYTIFVQDLTTGLLLPDQIPNSYYSLEWAEDNATFFYTILDAAKRPFKVRRHALGSSKDTTVYHEKDERFTVEVSKTLSRAYILIHIASSLTTEVRALSTAKPRGRFQVLLPRLHEIEYDVTHHGDGPGQGHWILRTNDDAKTFRVVRAPVAIPGKPHWEELLAARPEVTIESVLAFERHLVVEERDRGLIKLRIQELSSGVVHYVAFDDPAYQAGFGANAEYRTPLLRYAYTSLVLPNSIYDHNMDTRERVLRKRQAVLGGFDPANYVSERLYARAADGVEIPISLVYRRNVQRDGQAPMLLYGYGSYGISIDPAFSSDRLSLLDRGFVYAIAHIRGGGDLGKPWHEAGRLMVKRNTFTDFIAAAEHLIAQRYTSSQRLAIMGRSAGGLLLGAVLNLRPDLFAAAIAGVPFVDALTTELDATLPLTVGEWEEWGNPAEKPVYEYMRSYSPYDNVAPRDYPALLVTAGLNDPRVSYWEPAKWVAKLRALKTDQHRLLLKTFMGAGHFGASGRYEYLKDVAFEYAFLLDTLNSAQSPL